MLRSHLIVCRKDKNSLRPTDGRARGLFPFAFSFENPPSRNHILLNPADCMLIDREMTQGNEVKKVQELVHCSSRSKIYMKVRDEAQRLKVDDFDLPVADVFNGKDAAQDIVRKMKCSSKTESEVLDRLLMLFT